MARGNATRVWYFFVVLVVSLLLLVAATQMVQDGKLSSASGELKCVVFLREQCYQSGLNVTALQLLADDYMLTVEVGEQPWMEAASFEVDIVSQPVVCEELTGGLATMLEALASDQTSALIGSIDPSLCEMVAKLAALRGKPFITWSCPQITRSDRGLYSTLIRLVPSLSSTADSLVRVVKHFRWKTVAILSTDSGWWPQLAHLLDLSLRRENLVVRHHLVLPDSALSVHQLATRLQPLQMLPCRVVIVCLPLRSALADNLLQAIDILKIAHLPSTALLAVHLAYATPFLPPVQSHRNSSRTQRHLPHEPPTTNRSPHENSLPPTLNTDRTISLSSVLNPASSSEPSTPLVSILRPNPSQYRSNSVVPPLYIATPHPQYNSLAIEPSSTSKTSETSTTLQSAVPGASGRPRRSVYSLVEDGVQSVHSKRRARYFPPPGLSDDTRKATLVLSASDSRFSVEELFGDGRHLGDKHWRQGDQDYWEIWQYIKEGLAFLTRANKQRNSSSNVSEVVLNHQSQERFVLLDLYEPNRTSGVGSNVTGEAWRPLLQIDVTGNVGGNGSAEGEEALLQLTPLWVPLEDWVRVKQNPLGEDGVTCVAEEGESCSETLPGSTLLLRSAHIVAIVICSAMVAAVLIIGAAVARKQLLKKRMSKGPYKILLTTSDFVFPHVADSLRVDEGIEAMLCCWLQQLQEFGGPEVDKPDLLKGSIGSLRSHAQIKSAGSTTSLTRNLLVDTKARYNGDLVQLKEMPLQGAFELKNKAMDVLVTLHGLRHENLNVLIGCLTDPARPALVLEWCSRGSLEDVLVQDEIKLDWSFRLSLLTDLVRGMRYLHSCPIKIHGYLTSRNCVIDARWVLKITDYGLPLFYEAQNVSPPSKTPRDLLWTAPELLRNPTLRKLGTQPGDVYSFGIIMQEVVVRGEPFCMLSLSPEDIIEKVKKPPPLIRPSVSKGAAPPEAINIMRQCWAEQADMRPDFNSVHDLFKKLNHGRKVNFVDTMFQMLEKYSNNLEELIRERTEQLDMEKKKTEQLLNRMLPSSVADKLKLGMPVDPEDFREVTIYFSDIVGFTTISAYSTPFEVVDLLNDLYTCFDATINAYNVYKVETIGDAYMVVGGLPVRIPDHADQIATMALDLLHQSGRFKIRHLPYTPLRLRIGLHTGPCCAGVVGLTMPRYCLFGDTVNTASRMESTGSAWRIHMSQATKERLDEMGDYHIEYRGETELKGKGKMQTYWLLGKAGFDKQLPTPPPIGESHGLDERLIRFSRAGSSGGAVVAEERTSGNNSFNQDNSSGEVSASFASNPRTPPKMPAVTDPVKSLDTRVSAAIHNEKQPPPAREVKVAAKVLTRSDSESKGGSEQGKQTETTSQDTSTKGSLTDHPATYGSGMGTPVSASEVAAALLGVTAGGTTTPGQFRATTSREQMRHRRVAHIDEDDLSTPYNHYRCLSPSEQHLNHLHHNNHYLKSHPATGSNRFLKRQFSLDRGDDSTPVNILPTASVSTTALDSASVRTGRLFKQNSAGAAHDLERIEEIPLGNAVSPRPVDHRAGNFYRQRCDLPPFSSSSMSVSVESLN